MPYRYSIRRELDRDIRVATRHWTTDTGSVGETWLRRMTLSSQAPSVNLRRYGTSLVCDDILTAR